VEGQEPLAGEVEAVVRLQLAVGNVDEDPLLEIEQLENGQSVSLSSKACSPALRGRRVAVKLALGMGKPTLT
jgi:hypothetical protein